MKNIEKLEIAYFKVEDLIPYDKNPRKNERAIPFVKASIEKFGFKIPLVIDENKVVVCGHTRLKAAKELGLEEVPCIMASDLTPEQVRAFRIADNKVSEIADWDFDLLDAEMAELPEFDFGDFGFVSFDGGEGGVGSGLPPELAGKDLTPDNLPDKGGEIATGGRIIIVFDEDRRHELEEILGVKELPFETVTYQLDDIVKMREENEPS